MTKILCSCYALCLLASLALNTLLLTHQYARNHELSWSQRAAEEAEEVASITCSGHGRAYIDGLLVEGKPVCECNSCYGGSDCSEFSPDCTADADSGDPLFLEPFWSNHAATSAVLVAGWHRMSYRFNDHTMISQVLEKNIRKVHTIARNAITEGRYILFGGGSTQLLAAAVFALSMNSSSRARVVAQVPYYPLYKSQTDFFQTARFKFQGDTSSLRNLSGTQDNVIEFVTSPNNPDGLLKKPVLHGPNVMTIHDHAYYWPHFTAIPAPADDDLMIFTLSKLTGHAGSRFGWAIVKDKDVYERMLKYIFTAEMGISREVQLRALQLVKSILDGDGRDIFDFAHKKMKDRWDKLSQIISMSKRFTLQEIPNQFCNFYERVRGPSPAYGWLKCERKEDTNCNNVLRTANIIGRNGSLFNADAHYVRLSLLKSDDDFNLLLHRLTELVSEEDGPKTI